MKLLAKDSSAKLASTELLIAFGAKGKRLELPDGVELSAAAKQDFDGKARETRLCDPVKGAAKRVLLVGLGEGSKADLESLRRAAGVAVKAGEKLGVSKATVWVSPAIEKLAGSVSDAGQGLGEALVMGAYKFNELKSKAKEPSLTSIDVCGSGAAFKAALRRGQVIGEANCYARDLANRPGNKMRPSDFASEARAMGRASKQITTKILNEKQMGELKMGSLLSVSAGSIEPAFLVHMTYKPKGKSKGKLCLVGKGLTFDSGGISLKPGAGMEEMKFDMCGGAAVMGVFHALKSLDFPYEVHGVVATSENMPAHNATKPGDVVTAMNGKTIEVINTDAEGRLILADALCYVSKKIKPDTVIDLATLTGAVIVALGHELTGMYPTTRKLANELTKAGERTGELVWELPLLDCHKDQLKGTYSDLRNINRGQGNGSTAGAAFLSHFIDESIEWCHLDIAGTAWKTLDRDYRGGATGTGVGVRLLLDYLHHKS
jgi:leucyl aminopeptidase